MRKAHLRDSLLEGLHEKPVLGFWGLGFRVFSVFRVFRVFRV